MPMTELDPCILEQSLRFGVSDKWIVEVVQRGNWHGMPTPGDQEWDQAIIDEHGRPVNLPNHRLYVLGLAQYTLRHPAADHIAIAIAADVLHSQATGWAGPYPIEEDPRHDRATAWLLAVAGGYPAPPGDLGCISFTPPIDRETGRARVPGGTECFTRFAVEFLDRLLFLHPEAAKSLASDYLTLHQEDPLAQRAEAIFSQVKQWRYAQPDATSRPICDECGKSQLERWYTAKSSGYQLCPDCFEQRVRAARAREAEA